MPREIKAYACKYKCGQRINSKKEAIEAHEKICFANQKNRACKTCAKWSRFLGKGKRCSDGILPDDQYATSDCSNWKSIDDICGNF